ncbi:uncharacterized protein LOC117106134 isoform X2 [Anneissia japonica]|uniref:uncharacterized protein LOC117106134 isoform X2 n=1 Tax=Anneissia japonica TaxID=1529436 RepID=UPI0014259CCF|nr:uncharacterized protein LOC117106134 isoform X2 [Anneissia japonica]
MSDRTSPKVSSFPDTAMPTVSCQSLQTAYTSPKNLMRLIFLSAYECGSPMLSSSFGEMSPSFGGMSTLMCLGLYNLQLGFLKSNEASSLGNTFMSHHFEMPFKQTTAVMCFSKRIFTV